MSSPNFAGSSAVAASVASFACAVRTGRGRLWALFGLLAAANLALLAADFGLRLAALAFLFVAVCVGLRALRGMAEARRAAAEPAPRPAPYRLSARAAVALAAAARARR